MKTLTPTIALLIPAYQPDTTLLNLAKSLNCYYPIVIVNDGSTAPHTQQIFTALSQLSQVKVLHHERNLGKGAALKTGLTYLINHTPNFLGVVTLDADGQHSIADVLKVAEKLEQQPHSFILGVRNLEQDIPLRSKVGNAFSCYLFNKIYKLPIQDTQTGLRGIPAHLIKSFLTFESKRYEFETQCLIYIAESKAALTQLPIATIYLNNNQSSHFNPLIDSARIFFVFLRFLIISTFSFVIDLSVFSCLHYLGASLISCVIVARLISSSFNFYNNKFAVYRSAGILRLKQEIIQYAGLAVIIMLASYYLIKLLSGAGFNVIFAKIVVDGLLFTVSFFVQKFLVFRRRAIINS